MANETTDRVYCILDALEFFLYNDNKKVICVKRNTDTNKFGTEEGQDRELEVGSYEDAVQFFSKD